MLDFGVNPVRYPTLFRYLSGLPHGVNSHPECQCTADFAIGVKSKYGNLLCRDDLPQAVRDLLGQDLRKGTWIPEVHFMVINALVRDIVCKSDEKYLQFCYDTMAEAYASPFMRSLMYLMSPSVMALATESRWAKYRKGVTLKIIKSTGNSRTLQMKYPDKIYIECMLGGMGRSFEAALACTRIASSQVVVEVVSSGEALFHITWSV